MPRTMRHPKPWRVMCCRQDRRLDRAVARFKTYQQARADARARNLALLAEDRVAGRRPTAAVFFYAYPDNGNIPEQLISGQGGAAGVSAEPGK